MSCYTIQAIMASILLIFVIPAQSLDALPNCTLSTFPEQYIGVALGQDACDPQHAPWDFCDNGPGYYPNKTLAMYLGGSWFDGEVCSTTVNGLLGNDTGFLMKYAGPGYRGLAIYPYQGGVSDRDTMCHASYSNNASWSCDSAQWLYASGQIRGACIQMGSYQVLLVMHESACMAATTTEPEPMPDRAFGSRGFAMAGAVMAALWIGRSL
jgi:hypothetical protein